ncbi:MAG: NADH-quinone oxidoreductase subunit N [Planctomycetes bacterium]|nr:NADH-quinone oxidoreductase subunit N [Planctomycetota bacterium]
MNDQILSALVNIFPLIIPEMILGGAAVLLFLGATFRPNRHLWAAVALAALVLAGVALGLTPAPAGAHPRAEAGQNVAEGAPATPEAGISEDVVRQYASPLYYDSLSRLIKWIALAGGVVLVLFSWQEVPDRQAAEYQACLLIIVAGLCLTGVANELITLFLALELISIPTYILLYLPRHDTAAQEAAMKYFLLSVFSSALLLFGFSYLYGMTGTTNLPGILDALRRAQQEQDPAFRDVPGHLGSIALVALIMVTAGFCFKITAVPFHHYAPDVYQGAPTPAVALLAFMPKVAGFVALFRVLGFVFAGNPGDGLFLSGKVPILFWILAAVTMSLGNVLALLQSNVKRLLAYSSVAHAGYMLMGVAVAYQYNVPATEAPRVGGGIEAILFYLVAYGAMTIGAFGVLSYLSTPERPVEMEDDLAGLSRSHPGTALLMALFLFSLIGIPLTAGFAGKVFLFLGAMGVQDRHALLFRWLALIGVINSAIGGWYYLRIIAKMYLQTPVKPLETVRAWPSLATLWICALVTLVLGIRPGLLLEPARRAAVPRTAPAAQAWRASQAPGAKVN